ncbi:MAG TPA: tRNA (N(6)-L-threonylcarbamoyladenosine(37)-C(2))-methylthiotransferase, partial [Candidatus Aenigmarchaeota archaeon]|nr:tRNA (N(6)-L-threonylcarbamoyladenosine(37)-C(2))-methylthiotransferase [Candidatus Aenigmarchaeota archaeon]
MKKVYMEIYGCAANQADFEIAAGLLKRAGFKLTKSPKDSDLNLIFTCNVKVPTEQRMIYRIEELTKTGKPLIVAGCMPMVQRDLIERINPKASLIGPHSIHKIVDIVERTIKREKVVSLSYEKTVKVCLPRVRRNPIIAIVPIAEGCAWQRCTYCIVKYERGKLFSFPERLIVKEVESSVKEGCKEIWITSQDNACYGLDIGTDLPKLLNSITKVKGKFYVRVGMMNPVYVKNFVDRLINSYKSSKIFKFLHLPAQSGSNRILKAMKRGYSIKDFVRIVEKFRKRFKLLTLSTDIIVGFPGESEEDFE